MTDQTNASFFSPCNEGLDICKELWSQIKEEQLDLVIELLDVDP